MEPTNQRMQAEWLAVNAFRGLTKIATKGDISKSTYDNAFEIGGELYPELLGADVSILRREREGETAKEYRQLARLRSIREQRTIDPVDLLQADIRDRRDLLGLASASKDKSKVDQIKRRLSQLVDAEKQLNPVAHSENQLIFRDATLVERNIPALRSGKGYRDFSLADTTVLRVRVLHPDKPEHLTGADIIYERHDTSRELASLVVVQYKIWEGKKLYLSEPRMQNQLDRLRAFSCDRKACEAAEDGTTYRFPHCAAFIRPTDKLQNPTQSLISTGEHLPVCLIPQVLSKSRSGSDVLEYGSIRDISLSADAFEYLFNKGKIGSRELTYPEISELYKGHELDAELDSVVIYAQEFSSSHAAF